MIAYVREVTGISLSDNEVESIFSADEEINEHTSVHSNFQIQILKLVK